MLTDVLSAALRSGGFVALLQAAGIAIFIALFGRRLTASLPRLRRIARATALVAIGLGVAHYLLEAAKMAGDLSGIMDSNLQRIALGSRLAPVLCVRLAGLLAIVVGLDGTGGRRTLCAPAGALAVAASFALMGHTVESPLRWVLAPLLFVHVLVAEFWFGALVPLYLASVHEEAALAGQVTAGFSSLAVTLVPFIALAGGLMAWALVPDRQVFAQPYGLLLLGKFAGFLLLLVFAALNKTRLGPAIGKGNLDSLRAFRRSLGLEYLLMAAVLCETAVMTSMFSPMS